MVMTSAGNAIGFDKVKHVLILQQGGRLHIRHRGNGDLGNNSTIAQRAPRNPSRGNCKARYFRSPQACHAAGDSWHEQEE
eukprot:69507-Pyramimonas_sp.AAC.1